MTMKPPLLAQVLLKIATDRVDRSPLIGDLNEEFARMHSTSPGAAYSWYWRQMIFSTPALIWKRLRQSHVRQLLLVLLVTGAGYVAVAIWDIFIARRLVQLIAGSFSDFPLRAVRGIYILLQVIGVALAGGLIAALTFRPGDNYARNVRRRLAPFAIILFIPPLVMTFLSENGYSLTYRLIWLSAAAPALLIGAFFGYRFSDRRRG